MRIAVPNKGRLHDPTMDLLERAGIHVVDGADRKLYADTVDPEVTVLFVRAADIPEYVADGAADLGVTGLDQVREAGHPNVTELLDLAFGRCRLVVATPEADGVDDLAELEGATVATEFPNVTYEFFADRGVEVDVVEVTGATELTPHVDMADAIVDITSTGTTLQVNRLEIVAEVLDSSVHLIAREDVASEPKAEQLRTALRSVIQAEGKRYLMMNVPEDRLDDVRAVIPGLGGPTVMDIDVPESDDSGARQGDSSDGGQDKVAVHAVVDERDVFETINEVKAEGASDILVTEIERLVE